MAIYWIWNDNAHSFFMNQWYPRKGLNLHTENSAGLEKIRTCNCVVLFRFLWPPHNVLPLESIQSHWHNNVRHSVLQWTLLFEFYEKKITRNIPRGFYAFLIGLTDFCSIPFYSELVAMDWRYFPEGAPLWPTIAGIEPMLFHDWDVFLKPLKIVRLYEKIV